MNNFLSVKEAANLLGISKTAVIKQIQAGKLPAVKIGNIYVINKDDLTIIRETQITATQQNFIDQIVNRTINEYGETLHLLKNA